MIGSRNRVTLPVLSVGATALVLFMLIGCTTGSGAGEASRPGQPGQRASSNGAPSASATVSGHPTGPGGDGSTVERPDGIFKSSPVPLPPCPSGSGGASGPGADVDLAKPIVIERLKTQHICFTGFTRSGSPIRITLTAPGGTTQTFGPDSSGGWTFTPTLRTVLGDHSLRVSQPAATGSEKALTATGVVRVVRATEPRMYRTANRAPSGGVGLQIELAGFPPAPVSVYLYGPRGGEGFPFSRSLPPAGVSAEGEGSYSWAREPGAKPGVYAIWLNPSPAACSSAFSTQVCADTE